MQRARLFVDVAAVGGQQLDLLLHLGHLAALLVAARLRDTHGIVECRQLLRLLLGLRGQQLGLLVGGADLLRSDRELACSVAAALLPGAVLRLQLVHALHRALAAFDDVADALLEPADFERGFGQQALRTMQLVTGLRSAPGARFRGRPRPGAIPPCAPPARWPLRPRAFLTRSSSLAASRCFRNHSWCSLSVPWSCSARYCCATSAWLSSLSRLALSSRRMSSTRVRFSRVSFKPVLGLAAAFLVLGHAGGLFEEQAQFLGLAFDDAADRALADDGVGARAQAGAEEHVLHVAAAHRLVVDVVAGVAVAREHALDGDLGELVPLPAGARVGVVEHQLDAGAAGRLALARAVEDHVLHRFAAQLAGLAFAQHPAHGVHDVGLAAAVGPDHADQLAREVEGWWVRQRT